MWSGCDRLYILVFSFRNSGVDLKTIEQVRTGGVHNFFDLMSPGHNKVGNFVNLGPDLQNNG